MAYYIADYLLFSEQYVLAQGYFERALQANKYPNDVTRNKLEQLILACKCASTETTHHAIQKAEAVRVQLIDAIKQKEISNMNTLRMQLVDVLLADNHDKQLNRAYREHLASTFQQLLPSCAIQLTCANWLRFHAQITHLAAYVKMFHAGSEDEFVQVLIKLVDRINANFVEQVSQVAILVRNLIQTRNKAVLWLHFKVYAPSLFNEATDEPKLLTCFVNELQNLKQTAEDVYDVRFEHLPPV